MALAAAEVKPFQAELHPAQKEWFMTEATEMLVGGAAGPGKSFFLRTVACYFAGAIPGLQVYLLRRESPDLVKNHINHPTGFPVMLGAAIARGEVKWKQNPHEFKFSNGSMIHLGHCQYEKDMYAYQGAEIHLLLIDELTTFLESIYRFIRGRVRMVGVPLPEQWADMFPRIIAGSNPGNIGHNWVKKAFVDPAPYKQVWVTPKSEGGFKRVYMPARMDDNPALMLEDPDYADRLDGLGNPALVRAMKNGDWDITAGGMFDDLWRRDLHVIEPFKIPASWRVDRSFDWGSARPFSVGWWAESDGTQAPNGKHYPRGTLFRIKEWYGSTGNNEGLRLGAGEVARGVKERDEAIRAQHGVSVEPGPADSAIFSSENGPSVGDDMAAEGVYWLYADKRPGSRIAGWEQVRKRLKATGTEDPGLYVFNTCVESIAQIPTTQRDKKKPDDVDTNSEDHLQDEWRYRINTAGPVTQGQFSFA